MAEQVSLLILNTTLLPQRAMAKATVKENAFFKSSSDFYMLNSTNIQEKVGISD